MSEGDDRERLARLCSAAPGAADADAREALRELYDKYARAVATFAERLLGERAGAEDVLQETFLAVARRPDSFRAPPGARGPEGDAAVRAWLLTIAANRVRDELRRRERRRRREGAVARPPAVELDTPGGAGDPRLEAALARLPGTLRAALHLRFAEELTHAQVAAVLGVSLRTAKDWSRRGLEALRASMTDDEEDR